MNEDQDLERCPHCRRFIPYCACTDRYVSFTTDCDCTGMTIEMAAQYCGPAFSYTLHVHETQELATIGMVRRFVAHLADHPCAPQINIVTHNTPNRFEWWLEANGKGMGSRSVG